MLCVQEGSRCEHSFVRGGLAFVWRLAAWQSPRALHSLLVAVYRSETTPFTEGRKLGIIANVGYRLAFCSLTEDAIA